ncbi:hypothetical protein [Natronosalvus vescus]|uniref:hypothetical protein n=1 Tax=Natronosalvus vescus TaxID=2953881 RepID=UPI0020908541|nr:hypothetical protein [Natronosalvus vescus]
MPRPPIWDSLWRYLSSDTGFYVAVGILTILVFVVAFAVATLVSPVSLTGGGLLGLVVGFGLFMAVFFGSIVAQRLEDEE